jgi:ornithine cyclodeaminase
MGLVESTATVRGIETVVLYSRREEQREAFAARARTRVKAEIIAARSPEEAVADADIVISITNSTTPALLGTWLPSECLVVAAGLRDEADEEVFARASQIVTTSKVQEMNIHDVNDSWPLVKAMKSGAVDWSAVLELGDVVSGKAKPARGIRVLREAQGGFGDVALAALAYERATAFGRGSLVDLD